MLGAEIKVKKRKIITILLSFLMGCIMACICGFFATAYSLASLPEFLMDKTVLVTMGVSFVVFFIICYLAIKED